jgi:hypothetical protein
MLYELRWAQHDKRVTASRGSLIHGEPSPRAKVDRKGQPYYRRMRMGRHFMGLVWRLFGSSRQTNFMFPRLRIPRLVFLYRAQDVTGQYALDEASFLSLK